MAYDEDRLNRMDQRRESDNRISMREWGGVLERLRQQDLVMADQKHRLESMEEKLNQILEMANRGKGGLMMLTSVGSIVGVIVGWVVEHLIVR